MTKVKICGIINEEDAITASELGADFLGFIVEIKSSEDSLTRIEARDLIKKLPLEVIPVLVTNLTNSKEIIELAKILNPAVIQLHNDISNHISVLEIGKIREQLPRIKLTKAIHIDSKLAIKKAVEFSIYVDYLLLDTRLEYKIGGTGKTHDWQISKEIVKTCKKPVFLAGGLTPENVIDAITKVNPYAVDVNSGVKAKPRIKDPEKLRLFIRNAKSV